MFDLHIHTNLSECCGDENMTLERIVAAAADAGLTTIGIADHVWDKAVPGASGWYESQTVEHILQIRSQPLGNAKKVHILFGCETEYLGNGILGLSEDSIPIFDFILIPATHFHMKGYVAPEMNNYREVASLMKQRFDEIVELKIPNSGVAHPFLPLGYLEQIENISEALGDKTLLESFKKAADADISIEITTEFFPSLKDESECFWSDDIFIRILSLAKQAGCKFHLASDAHWLKQVGWVNRLKPILERLDIKSHDLWLGR